jgi:hypothetical protein
VFAVVEKPLETQLDILARIWNADIGYESMAHGDKDGAALQMWSADVTVVYLLQPGED